VLRRCYLCRPELTHRTSVYRLCCGPTEENRVLSGPQR
jgi:hypothetical protein